MKIQKIGIALAAYQPEPQIFFEQLKSIQNQTFKNWVCCITSDSTLDAIYGDSQFESIIRDERFKWSVNSERLGHRKNFQKAIEWALEFS
ncbi:MAG: hypothetical protein KGQ59_08830, partial [Bdellovibrionales bacterium]|nr:hypothetical protein [Bdellovibrionales bacterium]